MKTNFRLFLSLALLSGSTFAATDPETAQLRAQVEQLQAQIRAMQAQCPAVVSPTVSALPPPAPVSTPAPVPLPAQPAATLAPSAPATATPTQAASTPAAAPAGYKLVKVDPNEEPPLPKDDRWRDPANWDVLTRDMSMAEVEATLGTEHRVQKVKDRVQWTYGKVGPYPASRLIFVDGRLAVWEAPNF